jgi:hypothetical protein
MSIRLAASLAPMLMLIGCTGSYWDDAPRVLGDRLQNRLTPELASGQAGLTRLPDGAQVVLTEQALFPGGGTELDDRGRYLMASVIEGLLEPTMLRIELAGTPGTPIGVQQARLLSVTQYLEDFRLGPQLQPALPQDIAAQGMAITVRVSPT